MSHLEELIGNLLTAGADLSRVELDYLDADTSHDKKRANAALESAVYAQFEADGMLDDHLDEVWRVTFNETFCNPSKADIARALGCPIDKLCKTASGSWTMR